MKQIRFWCILCALFCLSFSLSTQAQKTGIPQSFSHLTLLELGDIEWSDSHENPKVYFEANFSEVINKPVPVNSPFYSEYSDDFGETIVISTKLHHTDKWESFVLYSDGPSGDPSFSFYTQKGDSISYLGSVGGLSLFIPGNGNIYVSGHANNYFNKRKKYTVSNGNLTEVEQPFYYVGLETQTQSAITIYKSPEQIQKVAVLPANSAVEILINESDNFLIRTSFGLTGWWKLDPYGDSAFPDIYFNGD